MQRRATSFVVRSVATLVVAPLVLIPAFDAGASVAVKKPKLTGSIVVSAASSLTQAFQHIATKFEKQYPHTSVTFNFGSSTTLATQVLAGAPADVFASADLTDMDTVVSAGYVRSAPTIFARNQMEIAVKPGNPSNITGLSSLPTAGIVSLCAATAPCGKYAANILLRAGVNIPASVITREPNSQSTVQQVALGDANAAIVYVTDVNSVGKQAFGVKIPAGQNTIADYPIASLTTSRNPKLAKAFVAYVRSPQGQKSLHNQGFLAP